MKTLKDYNLTIEQIKEVMAKKGITEIESIEVAVYKDGSYNNKEVTINRKYEVYVLKGGNKGTFSRMNCYEDRVSACKTYYTKKVIKEREIKFEKVEF